MLLLSFIRLGIHNFFVLLSFVNRSRISPFNFSLPGKNGDINISGNRTTNLSNIINFSGCSEVRTAAG
jgi:hypothetical protein